MKAEPITPQEEVETNDIVVMSPVEDEWDNINGDLVLF